MLVVCSHCTQMHFACYGSQCHCHLWSWFTLVRVDSPMENCIESRPAGWRPLLVSVCMFSECTVQLLLGVACEACGSRLHCLVLALNRTTYTSLVSNTTVEGVIYSVQLDDTVVDCRCASTHGLASNGICSFIAYVSSWSSSGVLAGWVDWVSGC